MTSCGEAGIMGTVVGMMGVAQAGEAIKILASALHLPSAEETNLTNPYLLIYSYDLQSGPNPLTFRALKMAGRRKKCFACGENSALTLEGIKSGTPNYDQFCSVPTANVTLPLEDRITALEYHNLETNKQNGKDYILIDTREKEHFSFGSINGAINIPFGKLLMAAAVAKKQGVTEKVSSLLPKEVISSSENGEDENPPPIFVVCRRGLDSQEAVEKLKEMGLDKGGKRKIMDIIGGMKAWKQEVDTGFPFI